MPELSLRERKYPGRYARRYQLRPGFWLWAVRIIGEGRLVFILESGSDFRGNTNFSKLGYKEDEEYLEISTPGFKDADKEEKRVVRLLQEELASKLDTPEEAAWRLKQNYNTRGKQ
jgi:hypothetical protein